MNYYFVSTDHFEDKDWFRDDEDFKTGMNHIAVVKTLTDMNVLSFVLMSNHLHFILQANQEGEVKAFLDQYKQLYSTFIRHKYGLKEYLRRNHCDIRTLSLCDEKVERAIAYTVMNPVAARLCATPEGWRWGCGSCYFTYVYLSGRPLAELSGRQCRRILHSKKPMNPGMILSEDGLIWPQTYIDTSQVEQIFRSPARYQYFIHISRAAKNRAEQVQTVFFRDQTVRRALPEIVEQRFGTEKLDGTQLAELAIEMRRRFHSDAKQVARVLGMREEAAAALLQ